MKTTCVYCGTEQMRKYIDIIASPISCYRSKKQVLNEQSQRTLLNGLELEATEKYDFSSF